MKNPLIDHEGNQGGTSRVHRFFPAYQLLWKHGLSPAACRVHCVLASWWHTTGEAFASIETIAKETYLDRRTVQRAIRELQKEGFVYVHYGRNFDHPEKNNTNVYEPRLPDTDPGAFAKHKITPKIQKQLNAGIPPEKVIP